MTHWPPLWQEIRDRWLNGSSTARIAKALNVSEAYVHNRLPNVLSHREPPEAVEPTTPLKERKV